MSNHASSKLRKQAAAILNSATIVESNIDELPIVLTMVSELRKLGYAVLKREDVNRITRALTVAKNNVEYNRKRNQRVLHWRSEGRVNSLEFVISLFNPDRDDEARNAKAAHERSEIDKKLNEVVDKLIKDQES